MHRNTKIIGIVFILILPILVRGVIVEKGISTDINIVIKEGYIVIKYNINLTRSTELEYEFNRSQVLYTYSEKAQLEYDSITGILRIKAPKGESTFYVVLSNVHSLQEKVFRFEFEVPLLPVGVRGIVTLNISAPAGIIENYTINPPLNITEHDGDLITVIEAAEEGMRLALNFSIKPYLSGWLCIEELLRRIVFEEYNKVTVVEELVLINQGPRSVDEVELYIPPNSTIQYVRGAIVEYPRNIRTYGYTVTDLNGTIKLYIKLISRIGVGEKIYLKLGYSTSTKRVGDKLVIPAYYWPGILVKEANLEVMVKGTIEEIPQNFDRLSRGEWDIARASRVMLTVENLGDYELSLAITVTRAPKPILYAPILVIVLIAVTLYVRRRWIAVRRVEKPPVEVLVLTETMDKLSKRVMEIVSSLDSIEGIIESAKKRKIRRDTVRRSLREYSYRLNSDIVELKSHLKHIVDLRGDIKELADDIEKEIVRAKEDMLRALRLVAVRGMKVSSKDLDKYTSRARKSIERAMNVMNRLRDLIE